MKKEAENKSVPDTEVKILQAAEHEFMAKGYAGARTAAIAEAAGVTHAMFHYYFRTKEKLFTRIITEKIELLKEVVVKSFEDLHLPLEDMVRKLIDLHLDFVSSNPELPRFLIVEIFNNPERLNYFSQKIRLVAPDVLSSLQMKIDYMAKMGKCRRIDAKLLMLDIVSLNVFPYIAAPMVNIVLDNCMADPVKFLEQRKKENYDTIIRKLRP